MKRKTKIYFIIAATILLMIVNIVLSIIFRGDSGANIFTTISGWVSGVATIVLGLIAL